MRARTTSGSVLPLRWIRVMFLPLAMGVNACTLVNQELPNEAPVLQSSQVDTTLQELMPTEGQVLFCCLNRGGSVELTVRASDEDDDPIEYTWSAFGAGSFTDSTSGSTFWIAPLEIQGSSESFLLIVTISDHQPDTEDVTETFLVRVTQSAPTLAVTTTDTVVSFGAAAIVVEAVAADADGDPLTFRWELVEEGGGLQLQIESPQPGHSSATLVALIPGDYLVAVEATDGADSVTVQIRVRVVEPFTPDGWSVSLDLPLEDGGSRAFEMDVYEYPGQRGSIPLLVDSWFEAARLCADRGKRLCSAAEWQFACQGPEESVFSSVDDPEMLPSAFGRRFCNTVGSEVAGDNPLAESLAASGSFPNCSSSLGVYDLIGNAREWLSDPDRVGRATFSSVQTGLDFDCSGDGISAPLAPLPPVEEIDIFSQTQIDSLLEDSQYSRYGDSGIGFRCCR
jgi:formylglycine-generating enzyme required for sulfatase activity